MMSHGKNDYNIFNYLMAKSPLKVLETLNISAACCLFASQPSSHGRRSSFFRELVRKDETQAHARTLNSAGKAARNPKTNITMTYPNVTSDVAIFLILLIFSFFPPENIILFMHFFFKKLDIFL